jgi:hypothetical protein
MEGDAMGNPYYHDAYYGLDGLGSWFGLFMLLALLYEAIKMIWKALRSPSFLGYMENNLGENAKAFIGTLGLMLFIVVCAFTFRFLGYIFWGIIIAYTLYSLYKKYFV